MEPTAPPASEPVSASNESAAASSSHPTHTFEGNDEGADSHHYDDGDHPGDNSLHQGDSNHEEPHMPGAFFPRTFGPGRGTPRGLPRPGQLHPRPMNENPYAPTEGTSAPRAPFIGRVG